MDVYVQHLISFFSIPTIVAHCSAYIELFYRL